MNRVAPAKHPTELIAARGVGNIFLFSGLVFLSVYVPIALPLVLFGHYLYEVALVSVFFFMALALGCTVYTALVRVDSYHMTQSQRRRENLAWWLIAGFAALVMIARGMYAIAELSAGPVIGPLQVVPLADNIFAGATILFAAGLLLIPWADGHQRRATSFLIDAALVLVAIATMFWPLLFGPAIAGEVSDGLNLGTAANQLLGVFLLLALIFWIIIREIRDELWPIAAAFLLAIVAMVIIQLSHLAVLVASPDSSGAPVYLFTINAATSLSFLFIAVAGVLRIRTIVRVVAEPDQDPGGGPEPIHTWQIVLPYPLIAVLLLMRLSMELLGWGLDYRAGMIVGIGLITGFLMIRQVEMLRYNQYMYRKVADLAIRDGLTELFNHRAMHDALHNEVARAERSGGSLAVCFIDLDHFKELNDTYGHKQGDRVLIVVAEALKRVSRTGDVVGRYGGEEFMVIAPGITGDDAMRFGERIRTEIAALSFVFDGKRVNVTASVGVALYPQDSDDAELLIEAADQAMYNAKTAGRNVTRLYELAG